MKSREEVTSALSLLTRTNGGIINNDNAIMRSCCYHASIYISLCDFLFTAIYNKWLSTFFGWLEQLKNYALNELKCAIRKRVLQYQLWERKTLPTLQLNASVFITVQTAVSSLQPHQVQNGYTEGLLLLSPPDVARSLKPVLAMRTLQGEYIALLMRQLDHGYSYWINVWWLHFQETSCLFVHLIPWPYIDNIGLWRG